MGVVGLLAFFWSLSSGQYDDLDGAAERVLLEEDDGTSPAGEGTASGHRRSRSEDREAKLQAGGPNATEHG
ncbi:cbb3-type cytochrome oxidase assembly protein CcoS [Ensifer sp. WSM1721]|uniref:cbb3-type cytochrome oxidase assembly protein CcoS n=1 Tax=Ensifer sp. WSM1721 TaxID=1041159 RepID=UPI001FD8A878